MTNIYNSLAEKIDRIGAELHVARKVVAAVQDYFRAHESPLEGPIEDAYDRLSDAMAEYYRVTK